MSPLRGAWVRLTTYGSVRDKQLCVLIPGGTTGARSALRKPGLCHHGAYFLVQMGDIT